jgi:TIR domain
VQGYLEWYFEHEQPAQEGRPEESGEETVSSNDSILPFPVAIAATGTAIDLGQIELVIDRDFSSYSLKDQEKLLGAIGNILGVTSNLRIVRMRPGSVRLRLELPIELIDQLQSAVNDGRLSDYGVVSAQPIAAMDRELGRVDFSGIPQFAVEKPFIFVSYLRKDWNVVDLEVKRLDRAGYRLWYDRWDIPTGRKWLDEINNAIRDCSCILIFLSERTAKSDYVVYEIDQALKFGRA